MEHIFSPKTITTDLLKEMQGKQMYMKLRDKKSKELMGIYTQTDTVVLGKFIECKNIPELFTEPIFLFDKGSIITYTTNSMKDDKVVEYQIDMGYQVNTESETWFKESEIEFFVSAKDPEGESFVNEMTEILSERKDLFVEHKKLQRLKKDLESKRNELTKILNDMTETLKEQKFLTALKNNKIK